MSEETSKPKIQTPLILANMVTEINNADPDAFPPTDSVEPQAVMLCTVQDSFIRKVYSLQNFYRREAAHSAIDQHYSLQDDNTSRRLALKADTLNSIFWWMVHETYLHHPDHGSGIRKGWVLIKLPPQSFQDSLKNLFGG